MNPIVREKLIGKYYNNLLVKYFKLDKTLELLRCKYY